MERIILLGIAVGILFVGVSVVIGGGGVVVVAGGVVVIGGVVFGVDVVSVGVELPAFPPEGGNKRRGLLLELPVSPRRAATAGQAVQFENVRLTISIARKFIFFVITNDCIVLFMNDEYIERLLSVPLTFNYTLISV